jgi:hypothetical protein
MLALLALGAAAGGAPARAQAPLGAPAAPAPPVPPVHWVEDNARLHLRMSPVRPGTAADTARAAKVAETLRAALAKYRDTSAAVADGYRLFLPKLKEQKVYHFTNNWRVVQEGFRFDPARPTSILYKKDSTGKFVLVGAMYVAPKRFRVEKLDARVPLSIVRWHRHVNWCVPKRGASERWLERMNGEPVFGPESPIATKEQCDLVKGTFHPSLFGWMLHANVFGDDPAAIWGEEHAGHDMQAAIKASVPK